jgi:hypothetical protein
LSQFIGAPDMGAPMTYHFVPFAPIGEADVPPDQWPFAKALNDAARELKVLWRFEARLWRKDSDGKATTKPEALRLSTAGKDRIETDADARKRLRDALGWFRLEMISAEQGLCKALAALAPDLHQARKIEFERQLAERGHDFSDYIERNPITTLRERSQAVVAALVEATTVGTTWRGHAQDIQGGHVRAIWSARNQYIGSKLGGKKSGVTRAASAKAPPEQVRAMQERLEADRKPKSEQAHVIATRLRVTSGQVRKALKKTAPEGGSGTS